MYPAQNVYAKLKSLKPVDLGRVERERVLCHCTAQI